MKRPSKYLIPTLVIIVAAPRVWYQIITLNALSLFERSHKRHAMITMLPA